MQRAGASRDASNAAGCMEGARPSNAHQAAPYWLPGPPERRTLRGDRATAPVQHIPNFRFSNFVSKHSAQMLDCFEQDWSQSSSRVQASILQEEPDRGRMKRPTDDQILTALCCGPKCEPSTGDGRQRADDRYCHRWDFTTELTRVRALLDNMANRHDGDQDRSHGSEVERAAGD